MNTLFQRGSAARFEKVRKKATNILRQKKKGDVLHPDVQNAMRNIKRLAGRGYTEKRWNKAVKEFESIAHHG